MGKNWKAAQAAVLGPLEKFWDSWTLLLTIQKPRALECNPVKKFLGKHDQPVIPPTRDVQGDRQ